MPNPNNPDEHECKGCHDTGYDGADNPCRWCVGGRSTCGPDPASWFAPGQWPRCACGFNPRSNTILTEHWRLAGFKVVDSAGQLTKVSVS